MTKFPPAVRDLAGRLVAGAAASGASSPVDRQSVASVALRAPPVLRVDFAAAAAATAAFLASARSRPVVGLATGGGSETETRVGSRPAFFRVVGAFAFAAGFVAAARFRFVVVTITSSDSSES